MQLSLPGSHVLSDAAMRFQASIKHESSRHKVDDMVEKLLHGAYAGAHNIRAYGSADGAYARAALRRSAPRVAAPPVPALPHAP